jgi:hypothetical protein
VGEAVGGAGGTALEALPAPGGFGGIALAGGGAPGTGGTAISLPGVAGLDGEVVCVLGC